MSSAPDRAPADVRASCDRTPTVAIRSPVLDADATRTAVSDAMLSGRAQAMCGRCLRSVADHDPYWKTSDGIHRCSRLGRMWPARRHLLLELTRPAAPSTGSGATRKQTPMAKQYLFNINEFGQQFCAIRARDAEHALDLAEKKFVRRRSDYNMGPDDPPIQVEWWAHAGEDAAANCRSAHRMVTVPNAGAQCYQGD